MKKIHPNCESKIIMGVGLVFKVQVNFHGKLAGGLADKNLLELKILKFLPDSYVN